MIFYEASVLSDTAVKRARAVREQEHIIKARMKAEEGEGREAENNQKDFFFTNSWQTEILIAISLTIR